MTDEIVQSHFDELTFPELERQTMGQDTFSVSQFFVTPLLVNFITQLSANSLEEDLQSETDNVCLMLIA